MKAVIETLEPVIRPVAATRPVPVVSPRPVRRFTPLVAVPVETALFHAWRP